MPYQITAETADEITLSPAGAGLGCLRWVISGFGLLALLIGGGILALRRETGADQMNLIAGTIGFMGLGFLLLGIFLKSTRRDGLTALVFDRRLGAVRVRSGQGEPAESYLAYSDIAGVDVKTRTETSSSSNHTYTNYTYHVFLRLHDGGRWYLTKDSTEEAAREQLSRLAPAVLAGAAEGRAVPPAQLPLQVERSTQGQHTTLRWRNPVTGKELLGTVAVVGFFGGVLGLFGVLARSFDDMQVFVYPVLGFIGLMFLYIIGKQTLRLWQDSRTRYVLVLGPDSVAYAEESLATGAVTHSEIVPLAQWYGLSYSFDDTAVGEERVLLLTKAAHAQYLHQQQQDLSFREIVGIITEKEQSRSLYFKGFSPAQRLGLVNWVRAEVQRQAGAK